MNLSIWQSNYSLGASKCYKIHTLLQDLGSRFHASVCLRSSFLQQKLTTFSVKLLPQRAPS